MALSGSQSRLKELCSCSSGVSVVSFAILLLLPSAPALAALIDQTALKQPYAERVGDRSSSTSQPDSVPEAAVSLEPFVYVESPQDALTEMDAHAQADAQTDEADGEANADDGAAIDDEGDINNEADPGADPIDGPSLPSEPPDPLLTTPFDPLSFPSNASPDPSEPTLQQPPSSNRPSVFDALQRPDFDAYRLGPGDSFFVSVRRFPDLNFQATLDIQGNVIVPLEGVTPFTGLTLAATTERIRAIYDQYVVNPDVSVTLVAQRGVEVTVLGEIVRPGFYPLGAPQLATALLSAGGTTGQADLRDVSIQRRLPDGRFIESRTIDLFTPLKQGLPLPDVALQDGDVITVGQLDPAILDEYDRDLVSRSTLAQPTITVRVLNYSINGGLAAIQLPNGSRFVDLLVQSNVNPDTANLGAVALIRFDEEAGRAIPITLDANNAFRGDPGENPPLQDNDVVIVNRNLAARISYALNTFTQPFRDVLGFLLFFESLGNAAGDLFGP